MCGKAYSIYNLLKTSLERKPSHCILGNAIHIANASMVVHIKT